MFITNFSTTFKIALKGGLEIASNKTLKAHQKCVNEVRQQGMLVIQRLEKHGGTSGTKDGQLDKLNCEGLLQLIRCFPFLPYRILGAWFQRQLFADV